MCICISKLIKYPLVIQEHTQGVLFAGFRERDDVDPVMARGPDLGRTVPTHLREYQTLYAE